MICHVVFVHLATIGFIVWMLLEIDFPANDCLSVSGLISCALQIKSYAAPPT